MPNLEPVVLPVDRYSLRHIGPKALVWPQTPSAPVTVLARTDMVARLLPSSPLPNDPDLVTGAFTNRLNDSGEASFTFPNSVSSDGVLWRSRFDPTGHLQFLEVYDNGELDFVGVIDQIPTIDEGQVQVHASDPWWLLKKAYVRDWTVVQAPRDVVEHGTQVWVPTTVDNFPAGALNAQWTAIPNSGTITVGQSGGVILSVSSGAPTIASPVVAVTATGAWQSTANIQYAALSSGGSDIALTVNESVDGYEIFLAAGRATFTNAGGGTTLSQARVPSAPSYDITLESDGEWVWAFVNGLLVGVARRGQATTTSLQTKVALGAGAGLASALVTGVLTEALQPLLQRGTDKGDYVLPGGASTYPSGGLHARYYNDLDLQSDTSRLLKIMAPPRSQAYAGSGPSEYQNQQDATINGQANPTPGAAGVNWSAKWFGAVYLKMSAGSYTFTITGGAGAQVAFRLWVGKTRLGDQILQKWDFTAMSASNPVTVTAASLAGSLPYGGGTVARDGWYPIKVEYAVDSQANTAIGLRFTPPASYTDPGGTALTSGASVVIPATSLSPLGCVDQRYQGVSHFDLVQQTGQGYGYQLATEPKQLESGLFPGVLAPRIREGHDTDIALQPDTGPRQDGEGLLNYSSGLDATDFCASLFGNGAGLQNGNAGQLQSLVYDAPTLAASLFDAQGWQDFSDASFTSLLAALLNAQLGLRLSPWQILSADPKGSPRLAFTWPLPGNLSAMRHRPGDGIRIQAGAINVWDTTPRQMLVITRNIAPLGITSTTATFAQRPRTPAKALKQALFSATRWQRNYQRQLVTLTGGLAAEVVGAGATTTTFSMLCLSPGDTIVRARLRLNVNTFGVSTNVLVNGVDQTSALNGPWSGQPVNLDIGSVASLDAGSRISVTLKNNSGTTATTYNFQLFIDVLR